MLAFFKAVKADAGLQQKLKAAANADAIVAIARAAGFPVSAEVIRQSQSVSQELSQDELEGVAGCYLSTNDLRIQFY
jgi:predicted ribosomally synthesized peptide with nif11-like leader